MDSSDEVLPGSELEDAIERRMDEKGYGKGKNISEYKEGSYGTTCDSEDHGVMEAESCSGVGHRRSKLAVMPETVEESVSSTSLGEPGEDDVVGANIDITTSSNQDREEHYSGQVSDDGSRSSPLLKEEEIEGDDTSFLLEKKKSNMSFVNSGISSLAQVHRDLQKSLEKKSKYKKRMTKDRQSKRIKVESDNNSHISSGCGSVMEPSTELKSKLDKKKLQLVIPKIVSKNLISKQRSTSSVTGLPTGEESFLKVEEGNEDESSCGEECLVHDNAANELTPRSSLKYSQREEKSLRLSEVQAIKQEENREGGVEVVVRHKDEVVERSQEEHQVEMTGREGRKRNRKSSSCDSFSSSDDDITISELESVIPSYPFGKPHTPSTLVEFSSGKNLIPRARRNLDLSVNSDGDLDSTVVKNSLQNCSIDDEDTATSPCLTVSVSRELTSLRKSISEPVEGDTPPLMDWESWNKDKKKSGDIKLSDDSVLGNGSGGDDDPVPYSLNNSLDQSSDKDKIGMQASRSESRDKDSVPIPGGSKNDDPFPDKTVLDGAGQRGLSGDDENERNGGASLRSSHSADVPVPSVDGDPQARGGLKRNMSETSKTKGEDIPSVISCTACGKNINWSTQVIHSHPRLGVLICQVS